MIFDMLEGKEREEGESESERGREEESVRVIENAITESHEIHSPNRLDIE